MKREAIIHNILYGTILALTLALTLILASCTSAAGDPEAGLPGFDGRTPLTLSGITVDLEGAQQTRGLIAPDEPYFRKYDILSIEIIPIDGVAPEGTPQYEAVYSATFNSDGELCWEPNSDPIYLEDVWNPTDGVTHRFIAGCGRGDVLTDQDNPALFHLADHVRGPLDLNPDTRTLIATNPLERQNTKLTLLINKGEGWASNGADFQEHLLESGIFMHTNDGTEIQPLATIDANKATFTCILPPGAVPATMGAQLLTIYPADGGPDRALRLNTALTPARGTAIEVTATYDNRGTFTAPTVTLRPWTEIDHPAGELPGYDSELSRFLAWADRMRNLDIDDQYESFTLRADIDLTGINWQPIEYYKYATFDGAGHTISGLTVNNTVQGYAGLFGYIYDATIKNLTLKDARVQSTESEVGSLAGTASGSTLIACRTTDCQVSGPDYTGILIGYSYNNTLIACHISGGSATATDEWGGSAGGFTGGTQGSTLIACVAEPGAISNMETSPGSFTGAITGYIPNSPTITACYWRTYTAHTGSVPKAIGEDYSGGSASIEITELTTPGISQAAADAMNQAIGTWNRAGGNACQWQWNTQGLEQI